MDDWDELVDALNMLYDLDDFVGCRAIRGRFRKSVPDELRSSRDENSISEHPQQLTVEVSKSQISRNHSKRTFPDPKFPEKYDCISVKYLMRL